MTSIYHIVEKATGSVIYCGKTNNITHRAITHKSYSMNPNSSNFNQPVYRYIREMGGFNGNYEVVEIYRLPEWFPKSHVSFVEHMEILKYTGSVKNIRLPRYENCLINENIAQ
jgi:hypothetical protein